MADRYGRWLTVSRIDLQRAEVWFRRYGLVAVVVGRMVPAVRTLVSVPAGITRMHCVPFFICSALGTLVWTALLAGAGYLLEGQYERVAHWIDPLSTLVTFGIVAVYLYRIVQRWPR